MNTEIFFYFNLVWNMSTVQSITVVMSFSYMFTNYVNAYMYKILSILSYFVQVCFLFGLLVNC